jgi:TRAP-type C4-dicarboxylate transport system permease large subunit
LFVDGIVAKVVLVPIIFPITLKYGIDPIHLGVLVTLHGAVGSATPPFGCDIFTAAAIFDEPFFKVARGVPPFVLLGIIVIVIFTLFPDVALYIPNLAFDRG